MVTPPAIQVPRGALIALVAALAVSVVAVAFFVGRESGRVRPAPAAPPVVTVTAPSATNVPPPVGALEPPTVGPYAAPAASLEVAVCIVPWNYPLLLLSWKLAPALAAGNTVVAKPSELTPLSTLLMAECLAELPRGVFNVVTGYGAEVGEPPVRHPRTDVIAFTGSLATGRRIATLAAERIKKLNLELGSNDPFIVCEDADLETAARAAAWAGFLNNGQVCTSAERLYVFDSIADRFVERLVEFTRSLRLGDPLDPDVELGPMISAGQRQKVEDKLAEAVRQGARVRCGGRRPEGFARGFFLEPAVVTDCTQQMALFREETFGPVLPVIRVKGIQEAVALANDSDFGLGASILTNNLDWAMTAMEGIRAGTFWINDPLTDNDAGPFGGMRMSGFGRELGAEGLEAFRDTRHVHLDYRLETKPYWFPYGRGPAAPGS
jgi:betaine-aldehyde dehydrogenase